MQTLLRDFRYAGRQLFRQPTFSLVVSLTLALGIGATLIVFLVLYGVLLRPLPFPNANELVRIELVYTGGVHSEALPTTTALFLARSSQTLSGVTAYDYIPEHANLIQGNSTVAVNLLGVTPSFFSVFGVHPILGRDFRREEGLSGAASVAILSEPLWRQRFAADPGILGRAVTLGSTVYTVIGIAPASFHLDQKADLWSPLHLTESPSEIANMWNVVARTRPDVTPVQLNADLDRVYAALHQTYPMLWSRFMLLHSLNLQQSFTADLRPALHLLMGGVALLLFLVLANTLSLLLTRAFALREQMSLRAALGASPWRIFQHLLAENFILAAAAGALGFAVSGFGARLLLHLSPVSLPDFTSITVGSPAVLCAIALTAGSALLFSLIPAWQSSLTRLEGGLHLGSARVAPGRHLPQKALVVSQVALSLTLLLSAALLLSSFWQLAHTSPGFTAENVLTFKNAFSSTQTSSTTVLASRINPLLDGLERIPGVESAAAVSTLPALPAQLTPDMPISIPGLSPAQQYHGSPSYILVTPHYFQVLRLATLAGRTFTSGDVLGSAPVAIVSEKLAHDAFPGRNVIGQRIVTGAGLGPQFADYPREIVGVVSDTRQSGLDQPAAPVLYLPQAQMPDIYTTMQAKVLGTSWVVRTRNNSVSIAPSAARLFEQQVRSPLLNIEPLTAVLSDSIARQRFSVFLFCGFGLLSLFLGAAGLYGVLSYIVAGRTREFGIRLALGCSRSAILIMVLREASFLLFLGLIIGVGLSIAGRHLLGAILYNVGGSLTAALLIVSLLLVLTGLTAALAPARRAASTEPMKALRSE